MSRLLIVSNRLPVTVEKKGTEFKIVKSMGGLATGLGSFYKKYDSHWIGWSGLTSDQLSKREKQKISVKLDQEHAIYPLHLTKNEVEHFYHGFCSKTIWPLFHTFTQYVEYDKKLWQWYVKVNKRFARHIVEIAQKRDTIWIHDYQLLLLPQLIRDRLPDVKIGFFLHIPFPSKEIFKLLPWREEIIRGLLGADLIGFHTYEYSQNFIESVRLVQGFEQISGKRIDTGTRTITIDSLPMGIDFDRFAKARTSKKVQKEIEKMRGQFGKTKVVLSIDRLDYTKGILQRLSAFDAFFDKYPKYREKVSMLLVAVPSRTSVDHYNELKKQVDEMLGKINGKHGTISWVPIMYLYRSFPFAQLVAMYNIADIALITPLRDGMNLIAKEYIASKAQNEGVLILSEQAGASRELGEALIVNPTDQEEIVHALKQALTMPKAKIKKANQIMQERLQLHNIEQWAEDFIQSLSEIKIEQKKLGTRPINIQLAKNIKKIYTNAKKRLFLLDYDGTLVPIENKPQNAKPDKELLQILEKLGSNDKNKVIIASGRKQQILQDWLGDLPVSLLAEHGAWIKPRNERWYLFKNISTEWKKDILPVMELYVERTPGSFIEEKTTTLAWHYRNANQDSTPARVNELKEALINLTSTLDLEVLEGRKVIEVKKSEIDKGKAIKKWIDHEKWDLILAAGDDQTDETLFEVLPQTAFSIRVGNEPSLAKYHVSSSEAIRKILADLVSEDQ